jgi:hypothetical protein
MILSDSVYTEKVPGGLAKLPPNGLAKFRLAKLEFSVTISHTSFQTPKSYRDLKMSYINYTTYTDAIGEWTLRREGPDFDDFPGSVPPFGVEASPPPTPPTPPPPAAAPSKFISLIKLI